MENKPTWSELIAAGYTRFAVYCYNERHIPAAQKHVDTYKKYRMEVAIIPLSPPGVNGTEDSKGRIIVAFCPNGVAHVHVVGEYAQ